MIRSGAGFGPWLQICQLEKSFWQPATRDFTYGRVVAVKSAHGGARPLKTPRPAERPSSRAQPS